MIKDFWTFEKHTYVTSVLKLKKKKARREKKWKEKKPKNLHIILNRKE